MSDIPFYQTRMGAKFFETDVPRLIDTLERLTKAVEKLVDASDENEDGSTQEDGQ